MSEKDNKQPPPIKYSESNFKKLADSLKQNMRRRKEAGKQQGDAVEDEKDKFNNLLKNK